MLYTGLDMHTVPVQVRADAAEVLLKPYDFDQLLDALEHAAVWSYAAKVA